MTSEPFVVRCPNCSTQNGVAGLRPVSGVCRSPLPVLASFESAPVRPPSRSKLNPGLVGPLVALGALAAFGFYVIQAASNPAGSQQPASAAPPQNALDDIPSAKRSQTGFSDKDGLSFDHLIPKGPTRAQAANPFADLIPPANRSENASLQPVPFRQGVLTVRGGGNRIAPLKITTPPGSERCYVKLIRGGRSVSEYMTLLISPGTTYESRVAVGSYWMKYATGQDWFGPQERFGPSTQYYEAKSDLTFSTDEDAVHGQNQTGRWKSANLPNSAN
jgi:hypothetical protein